MVDEQITLSDRYYFDYGGAVLPDGRVVFAQISFSYTGPDGAAEGVQMIHVFRSCTTRAPPGPSSCSTSSNSGASAHRVRVTATTTTAGPRSRPTRTATS